MKTSYFFSSKLNETQDLVTIAGSSPLYIRNKFSNLRDFNALKPPKKLVFDYKGGIISEEEYTLSYNQQLYLLNPTDVYKDLQNSILLCWERPGDFCHRRLVAEWITKNLGIDVPEL